MKLSKLRRHSIKQGLIIPDSEALHLFSCCKDSPSAHEMELANRKHLWPEMVALQSENFMAYMDVVEKVEIGLLKYLGLPKIDVVRADFFSKGVDDPFELPFGYTQGVAVAMDEWTDALVKDNGVYNEYAEDAFGLGLARAFTDIMRNAPEGSREAIAQTQLAQDTSNIFLDPVRS